MINLLDPLVRQRILAGIKTDENKRRKEKSLKEYEVYKDRLDQYVKDYLLSQFSSNTVLNMPVVSSINLSKRIIDKQATVYKDAPDREFSELTEDQVEAVNEFYKEQNINAKLGKTNRYYKLQNQALIYAIPKMTSYGVKFDVKCLLGHNYDVIPNEENPEIADAYILSAFDKSEEIPSDRTDEVTGDKDDYRRLLERYVVWSKDYNFIMNGNGEILTQDIDSPLKDLQIMPFIDVAYDKDFEYFVRQGQSVVDFTIQFNGALSDLGNVVKMQGYAVGYVIGPKGTLPQNLTIGPNKLIKFETDPNNPNANQVQFGYASPNADIAGSKDYVESLLNAFLTSRGLDSSMISLNGEGRTFTSGLERLLSMVDAFEATKEDFELFKYVERKLYDLMKTWNNLYVGTDMEMLSFSIPEESNVSVKFHTPEMIMTEQDKVQHLQSKIELGLISRVEAIAIDRGVDKEKAREIALEIDQEERGELEDDSEEETNT